MYFKAVRERQHSAINSKPGLGPTRATSRDSNAGKDSKIVSK